MSPRSKIHDSYPLRTVARLTGLSADLIRAWEKRYGVVSPKRGPRGARLYTADDVAILRLLGKVVASGRTISDVAKLRRRELQILADTASPTSAMSPGRATHERLLERALDAAQRFDMDELDVALSDALLALGSGDFVHRLAVPLLDEVGLRWSRGELSVADEHLTSGLLRSLLAGLIRSRRRSTGGPSILLATPSGERHELGILLVALLATEAGLRLCYLGPDLPADQLIDAARRANVNVVGLSLVNSENRQTAAAEVRKVERQLPMATELWIGGRDARDAARSFSGSRAFVVDDLDTLGDEFARLRPVAPQPS